MIESEASGQKQYFSPRPLVGYGNFFATVGPTANDDELEGYSINSIWYKAVFPDRLWICVDNTAGAAIWKEIPLVTSGYVLRTLFDHYVNETTLGTGTETLYHAVIPANTLARDGDKIKAEYAGVFTANGNNKRLQPKFAGTVLATGQVAAATATDFAIDLHIIRVSNSIIRYAVEFTASGEVVTVDTGELTGLDLAATNYDFDLDGRSISGAGEVTATTGFGYFIPAVVPSVGHIYEGLVSSGDTYEGLVSSSDLYEGVI